MTDIDELYALKNLFYLGAFQQVINDATNPTTVPKSDRAKLERKVYLHRAYVAQQRFNATISEINPASDAAELGAVRALAKYLSARKSGGGSGAQKDEAVREAQQLMGDSGIPSSPLLAVLVASVFYGEEQTDDALRILSPFSKQIECVALTVQIYLKMNRPDLARKEVAAMKAWADDATMAQLVEAWTNLFAGDEKTQEAFYTYDELSSSSTSAARPKLLVGKAVARMQAGKHDEAEELLLEALNMNSSDPEALANLVACARATGKPTDVVTRYIDSLREASAEHHLLQELALKEAMFERAAQRFQL
ncbi:coatomer epsilon subunit-domain-containing protein [Zopfochytrium polystomum]|nr:coatomer epsilon subunit-domain-containing protein [Zopfochytrium polystomum]